jgi:hypothetical protein
VRTTIDIPDDLYRELKIQAAKQGTTLRDLVLRGAKEQVRGEIKEGEENWRPWFGALRHLHEDTLRIQAFIDEEFSKIDPEEWA